MNSFSSVLGHEGAKQHLMTALSDSLVSHAYLIEGPRGVGKKTLSGAFIRALLCEDPVRTPEGTYDSCGKCRCCSLLDNGNYPDVKYIRRMKDKTEIKVDQIRDELVSDMQIKPYLDKYKIYVIEGADDLNINAQNAMLKTIEEPPAYGIVLLLAESENSFLPTILSRCVKISLSPLPIHLVCSALIGKGFPEPEAQAAAALVQGSLGDALKLSRDENFSLLRTELFDFLASLPTASPAEVMRGARLFESYKSSRDTLFSLLTIWFRDVSVYRETEDPSLLLIRDRMSAMKAYAETYSSEKILRICETIPDIYTKLQHNVNAALAIDCLLMEMMK